MRRQRSRQRYRIYCSPYSLISRDARGPRVSASRSPRRFVADDRGYCCFKLGVQRTSLTPECSARRFRYAGRRTSSWIACQCIEAPFAFCARISRRARINLMAICFNDGCKFVVRRPLRSNQDHQSGVVLLLPAGLDPLHAPKDEYAQAEHPSAEKNSPAPKQNPIRVVNHKLAAVVTPVTTFARRENQLLGHAHSG